MAADGRLTAAPVSRRCAIKRPCPAPPLPVYVQPQIPADGDLWTPGYWGYSDGNYRWNLGCWGLRVGFYRGINYGHGCAGSGHHGGRWDRGAFHSNQSVNNVNTMVVHNVCKTTVVNNVNMPRVSYNGGPKGASGRPDAEQRREREVKHLDPTPSQLAHERTAMTEPRQEAHRPVKAAPNEPQARPQPQARGQPPQAEPDRSQPRTHGDARGPSESHGQKKSRDGP